MKNIKKIVRIIKEWIKAYPALSTALIFINNDRVLNLLHGEGYDMGSTISLGKKDGTKVVGLDLWKSIYRVKDSKRYNLFFLRSLFESIIIPLRDKLDKNGYFNKSTPESEFIRIIFNAVVHDNKIDFKDKKPDIIPSFKNFKISSKLDGQKVLFDYMMPGDVYELLICLSKQLSKTLEGK